MSIPTRLSVLEEEWEESPFVKELAMFQGQEKSYQAHPN